MFEDFYKTYLEKLESNYPAAKKFVETDSLRKIISPFQVSLSQKNFENIKSTIKQLFAISRSTEYQANIQSPHRELLDLDLQQDSVLMAYDFHIRDDKAKLIEINTNASGYLWSELLYQTHGVKTEALFQLKQSFKRDFNNCNSIAIIDEEIEQQRMRAEFYMYKDLLKSWGYESYLCEYNDPCVEKVDGLYNRYCDFFLEEERSQKLKELYTKKKVVLSPHPKEYLLLADKERLIELSQSHPELDFLLECKDITNIPAEELWPQRKKYFFKPKNSFGSKSVYRGQSLTRKNFDRLYDNDGLIQEYFPPEELEFNSKSWKYDVRAYAYRDQLQMLVARVYQGQLTNFKTDFGGFAAIIVSDN